MGSNTFVTSHPKIKFTKENEPNQKFPSQEVLVYKKKGNNLGHTINRKKTHTNRYLNAKSHHHPTQL